MEMDIIQQQVEQQHVRNVQQDMKELEKEKHHKMKDVPNVKMDIIKQMMEEIVNYVHQHVKRV